MKADFPIRLFIGSEQVKESLLDHEKAGKIYMKQIF